MNLVFSPMDRGTCNNFSSLLGKYFRFKTRGKLNYEDVRLMDCSLQSFHPLVNWNSIVSKKATSPNWLLPSRSGNHFAYINIPVVCSTAGVKNWTRGGPFRRVRPISRMSQSGSWFVGAFTRSLPNSSVITVMRWLCMQIFLLSLDRSQTGLLLEHINFYHFRSVRLLSAIKQVRI